MKIARLIHRDDLDINDGFFGFDSGQWTGRAGAREMVLTALRANAAGRLRK